MFTSRLPRLCKLVLVAHLLLTPNLLRGQTELRDTAVGVVPADTAFLATSVHLDKQWQELLQSRFVQRLQEVAYVQDLMASVRDQWDSGEGQVGQAKAFMQNPNVQNAIKLLRDMFGDEVFVYGGADWAEALAGVVQFQRYINEQMVENPDSPESLLENLTPEDVQNLKIPTTIIGFRIKDEENARLQLDALEGLLRLGLGQVPEAQPFLERLARTDLTNGQVLSIALDLHMVPADELDREQQRVLERAKELLGDRQLVIELGVNNGILMIAFSGSSGQIEGLGQAAETLADHPTMKLLGDVQVAQLRSISYASEQLREAGWRANSENSFQYAADQISAALYGEFDSEEAFEEWQDQLRRDARWLDDKVLSMKPEFGDYLAWSQRIQGGVETVVHDLTRQIYLANGAPLHILNHAGQDPLGFFAFKYQPMPAVKEMIDYILDRLPEHAVRVLRNTEDGPKDKELAIKSVRRLTPVIREIFDVCADKLVPALSDNEMVFAFDDDWRISQLGPRGPVVPQPLPLPEFSIVCSVSDRDGLLAGIDDLFVALDRLVDAIREIDPSAVPAGYQIPRPDRVEIDGKLKLHYAQIASSVPVPGFDPQLAIGNDTLVFGYSDRHAQELLDEHKLVNRPAWLRDDSPVATVCYADWAGIIAMGRPWLELGLASASGGDLTRPLGPAFSAQPIPTGNDVLQIWDCLTSLGKYASTATVQEDGTLFMRGVWLEE